MQWKGSRAKRNVWCAYAEITGMGCLLSNEHVTVKPQHTHRSKCSGLFHNTSKTYLTETMLLGSFSGKFSIFTCSVQRGAWGGERQRDYKHKQTLWGESGCSCGEYCRQNDSRYFMCWISPGVRAHGRWGGQLPRPTRAVSDGVESELLL